MSTLTRRCDRHEDAVYWTHPEDQPPPGCWVCGRPGEVVQCPPHIGSQHGCDLPLTPERWAEIRARAIGASR